MRNKGGLDSVGKMIRLTTNDDLFTMSLGSLSKPEQRRQQELHRRAEQRLCMLVLHLCTFLNCPLQNNVE